LLPPHFFKPPYIGNERGYNKREKKSIEIAKNELRPIDFIEHFFVVISFRFQVKEV